MKQLIILFMFLPGTLMCQTVQDNSSFMELSDKDLLKWDEYGYGTRQGDHGQLLMSETDNSKGYMIVSPQTFGKEVRMSYDIMAMNAASVLVVELAAHKDDNLGLAFEESYNGNVKYMFDNLNMYMFAFHNAAHNKNGPFVRKWPVPGSEPLVKATSNVIQVGKYHHVELGIEDGFLFFEVDGKLVWNVEDPNPYEGGNVILRVRGTGPIKGACLIKNLKIDGDIIKSKTD